MAETVRGLEAQEAIGEGLRGIANAIVPLNAAPYREGGAYVASLTEAILLVGDRLSDVARGLESIAEAIRESK